MLYIRVSSRDWRGEKHSAIPSMPFLVSTSYICLSFDRKSSQVKTPFILPLKKQWLPAHAWLDPSLLNESKHAESWIRRLDKFQDERVDTIALQAQFAGEGNTTRGLEMPIASTQPRTTKTKENCRWVTSLICFIYLWRMKRINDWRGICYQMSKVFI